MEISFTLTWHLLTMIIIQIIIVARLIFIYCDDKFEGMFGGARSFIGTIFYTFISGAMWLIYGGFVWW